MSAASILAFALLQSVSTEVVPTDAQETDETFVEADAAALPSESWEKVLDLSQFEKREAFENALALNYGPVMPWQVYGASIFWKNWNLIQSANLGGGSFEFNDNYHGRNYRIDTDTQALAYAVRWFPFDFAPLYIEPLVGLTRWTGSIRPRGFDALNDAVAASLNSRFDLSGATAGANLGVMWIFDPGWFIDYNLTGISVSGILSQSYTVNAEGAKTNVRRQFAEATSSSNAQIRVGYNLKL